MNVSKRLVAALCLACLGFLFLTVVPAPVRGAGDSMSESDFELMRSDIRTKKASLIADRMKFTDQEAAAFWPVYRQYETELAAINDKKVLGRLKRCSRARPSSDGCSLNDAFSCSSTRNFQKIFP